MIRAGNYTISDNGFTVDTVNVGGNVRQALVVELPGGITNTALTAFCEGPIEVLDEEGNVLQTYTGPFNILSHGLKFTRASTDGDVAALTARVNDLEAELLTVKSAKESAVEELASLSQQLSAMKSTMAAEDASSDADSV
jgi:hypothetical protein